MAAREVVVVGSGAAGTAAALAATVGGAHVTLLEASEVFGGTTAISGGVAWIPGSPWASRAGVEDSPEEGLRHLRALALGDVDGELCETYVREGVRVMEAIEASTPLRWHLMRGFPDYQSEADGGSQAGRGIEVDPVSVSPAVLARVRSDPYKVRPATISEAGAGEPGEDELGRREREGVVVRGCGLVAGILATLLERGVEARTGARATSLMTRDGAVTGVVAGDEAFPGAVVLASGGFERNEELARTFLRGPVLAPAGPPSNRGDGLIMGMALGARLGNMSEAWWAPAMEVDGETIDGAPFFRILFTDCAYPGGVLVDGNGRRFVDEATNYSDLGRAFHGWDAGRYAFPGASSWLIFDAVRRAARAFVGDTVWTLDPKDATGPTAVDGAEADPEWLVRAETIADLAARIGLPATRLQETIDRFNEHAARGVDDDFGRGSYNYDRFSQSGVPPRPVAEPPFYALRVLPGTLGTKGGLKTDALARVLRADGTGVIEGLYAAGNTAANPFGCAYPGPGATVGPGLVFGWLAGETAASA